jgi:hypothetical protein
VTAPVALTESPGGRPLLPGDVLVLRGAGIEAQAIQVAAVLEGEPGISNHVAVLHHLTGLTWWAIEGRPGGVGWIDAAEYLKSAQMLDNAAQPKTDAQRQLVTAALTAAVGTPYDWAGIARDAADALDLGHIFASTQWGSSVPGHVVCSSLAAWAYYKGGLACPKVHPLAETTPGDWDDFILNHRWSAP